jgi:RNA polymerase sigma factor (sigma-70 family)
MPAARPPSSPSPGWQSALAALSLAVASIFVAFPIGASALLVWAAVLALAGAGTLKALGALDPASVLYGVLLSAILLTGAGVISVGGELGALVNRRRPRPPQGLPPKPGSSWMLRHPWLSIFAFALLIDAGAAPLEAAHVISLPGAVIAAGVVTGASLLVLFAAYASVRLWWLCVRGLGTAARRSSFVAGVVTTGSLLVTVAALFLGRAASQSGDALAALAPAARTPGCTGAPIDCWRASLQPPARPALPAQIGALPSTEQIDEFDDCVEKLHRDDPGGRGNAYRDAIKEAQRRLPNPEDAADVVHDTLITVCLGSGRLGDVRAYFVRSVQNNAGRVARRNRRFCPLTPDSPDWPVDQCVARSVEQQSIQSDMEAAAHDSLCSLDRSDQTVIQLYAVDDLAHREIGLKLGCSEATARQRYRRALAALRAEFFLRCR